MIVTDEETRARAPPSLIHRAFVMDIPLFLAPLIGVAYGIDYSTEHVFRKTAGERQGIAGRIAIGVGASARLWLRRRSSSAGLWGRRMEEVFDLTVRTRKARASAKDAILAMTEKLMVEEGYAAVTTRRIAREVGVTAALVHYHFPTTDDLLIALFNSLKDGFRNELADSIGTDDPLRSLWDLNSEPDRTKIVIEFMALANHRKVIRKEIADYIDHVRRIQTEALARTLPAGGRLSALAASVLVAGMARAIVMEEGLGVSYGHAEARAMVDMMIRYANEQAKD